MNKYLLREFFIKEVRLALKEKKLHASLNYENLNAVDQYFSVPEKKIIYANSIDKIEKVFGKTLIINFDENKQI